MTERQETYTVEQFRAAYPEFGKAAKRKPVQYEFIEQCKLFAWRESKLQEYPPLRRMYATGNGLRLAPGVLKKAITSGVIVKGCPDVWLPYPVGVFVGMVFELKWGKNGTTPEQEEWLRDLEDYGWKVGAYYSAEEAQAAIIAYLEGVGQPQKNPCVSEED